MRARACSHNDVVAAVDAPPFDRSNVDGFAVRAADTVGASDGNPKVLMLNPKSLPAASSPAITVTPGTCTAIATGGVIPRGADAVVMIEQTELIEEGTARIELRRTAAARTIHFLCRLRHRARRNVVAARHAHRLARNRHAGRLRTRSRRCGAASEGGRAFDRRRACRAGKAAQAGRRL